MKITAAPWSLGWATAVLCLVCGVVDLTAACIPKSVGAYTVELEACLLKPTCEEYVACRTEVSNKYNRPFEGFCAQVGKVFADGGRQ